MKKKEMKKYLLPLEERWKYATDFWIETFLSVIAEIGDIIGWDVINNALQKGGLKAGWAGIEKVLKKIEAGDKKDAITWGKFEVFVAHNAFPGANDSFLVYTPEKAHLRLNGKCLLWEKAKELKIDSNIDITKYCHNSGNATIKKISKNLKFKPLHSMCKGDDYCDCIVSF